MQPLAHKAHRTIPLAISFISAGPATECLEDFHLLDLNAYVTKGRDGYIAFEVTGDSMIEYIRPGALVVVDTWAEPKNGDVVASTVNGLTCITIFQNTRRGMYLVSANGNYQPKRVMPEDSFRVLGVVRYQIAGVRP